MVAWQESKTIGKVEMVSGSVSCGAAGDPVDGNKVEDGRDVAPRLSAQLPVLTSSKYFQESTWKKTNIHHSEYYITFQPV